jgi:hypothetical protein
MRTAEVALAGMLSALSIAIPLVFRGTPLQIYIPALQYSSPTPNEQLGLKTYLR